MMLPLEPIFFMPSLLISPMVLAAAYFCRRRWANYNLLWWLAIVISFVLVSLFAAQVLNTQLYSQRDRSPTNPGGFSTSPLSVIGVFIVETCLVIPAFPVLVGLALLPPRDLHAPTRAILVVLCLLYVVVLAWLMERKHAKYVADYQRVKQLERAQGAQGDQFRHLRRP